MEYDADSIYMDIFDIIKKMREKTGQVINRQERLEMRMDITTTPPMSPPPPSQLPQPQVENSAWWTLDSLIFKASENFGTTTEQCT